MFVGYLYHVYIIISSLAIVFVYMHVNEGLLIVYWDIEGWNTALTQTSERQKDSKKETLTKV